MTRLRLQPGLLDPANFLSHLREVGFDGRQRLGTGSLFARPGEIHLGQASHFRCGRGILVLGASEVELGLTHEARRLGALEEDEILVLPQGSQRDEIQLMPQGIQLPPLALVEDQLAQRLIVAEIALHEMEAGGERSPLPGRVGIEIRPPVGDDEGVGEDRAEAFQRAA